MQLGPIVASLEAIHQLTCSVLWSHKTLYTKSTHFNVWNCWINPLNTDRIDIPPHLCVTCVCRSMYLNVCVHPCSGFVVLCVSAEGKKTESKFWIYLSDVLHVRPGVLLQQKELVPHPPSFGAPQRNSIGVLSRQPRGPPPPPCSPSQGPEPGPWRAEVGHGPQHHQHVRFPSIHGHHTTSAFCRLPPSAVCVQWVLVRVSDQTSCCNLLKQERILTLT